MGIRNLLSTLLPFITIKERPNYTFQTVAIDFSGILNRYVRSSSSIEQLMNNLVMQYDAVYIYLDAHPPIRAKEGLIQRRSEHAKRNLIRRYQLLTGIKECNEDVIDLLVKDSSHAYHREACFIAHGEHKRALVTKVLNKIKMQPYCKNIIMCEREAESHIAYDCDNFDFMVSEDQDLIILSLFRSQKDVITILSREMRFSVLVNKETRNISLLVLLAHGNDFVPGIRYLTVNTDTIKIIKNSPSIFENDTFDIPVLYEAMIRIYLTTKIISHAKRCRFDVSLDILEYHTAFLTNKNLRWLERPKSIMFLEFLNGLSKRISLFHYK